VHVHLYKERWGNALSWCVHVHLYKERWGNALSWCVHVHLYMESMEKTWAEHVRNEGLQAALGVTHGFIYIKMSLWLDDSIPVFHEIEKNVKSIHSIR
jgi:hypothetical protein